MKHEKSKYSINRILHAINIYIENNRRKANNGNPFSGDESYDIPQ
jgi:hypothetical protein